MKKHLIHSTECGALMGSPCTCAVGEARKTIQDLENKVIIMEQTGEVNARALVKAQTTIENLTHWLQWALNELSGEDHYHTPKHDCEFRTNPEYGACDFCDHYWSAMIVAWPESKAKWLDCHDSHSK